MVQVRRRLTLVDRSAHRTASKWGQRQSASRLRERLKGSRPRMKNKDNSRKLMWWFLGVGGALQLYFDRELLAAFALFAAVFVVLGVVITSLYLLQKGWSVAVERVAESGHPMVAMAKRGVSAVEDLARRPLRRPGSAAA